MATNILKGTDWDPTHMANTTPSVYCLRRIRTDMREIFTTPLPGIFVCPDESVATLVHCMLTGPVDTPYEGGFFYLMLNCPDTYPNEPPKVKLMTTDAGRVRFNPNLYANGKVCLSILHTWEGPSWSPVQNLGSVLMSIHSLMTDKPYHNEPGFDKDERHPGDAQRYNDIIQHETIRVAVCGVMEKILGIEHKKRKKSIDQETRETASPGDTVVPEGLRDVIRDTFEGYFEFYEQVCKEKMHAFDGKTMRDPFECNQGTFGYGELLERLHAIKAKLEEEQTAE